MEKKILKAKLKEVPQVAVELEQILDFEGNWLEASAFLERAKQKIVSKLKNDMHEKIAMMTLEDIEFTIIPKRL